MDQIKGSVEKEIYGFRVEDGRIINPAYPHDLHEFEDERILLVMLVIPGIIPESLIIESNKRTLAVQANIFRDYYHIYQSKKMKLVKTLSKAVISGPIATEYKRGILSIKLALADKQNQ